MQGRTNIAKLTMRISTLYDKINQLETAYRRNGRAGALTDKKILLRKVKDLEHMRRLATEYQIFSAHLKET